MASARTPYQDTSVPVERSKEQIRSALRSAAARRPDRAAPGGSVRRYKQRGDFLDSLHISQERYSIEPGEMVQIRKLAEAMLRGRRRS